MGNLNTTFKYNELIKYNELSTTNYGINEWKNGGVGCCWFIR
jgi:hypothetical protein